MSLSWYHIILYAVVGAFLLWVFDKFGIIRPKPLRYFIVILAYTLVCWGIYDLVI